jgi:outer membrane immunogenic protein
VNLRLALLGATFLAGVSVCSAANAADVYARGESLKDTPAYMPAISWMGFYIGVNAGGVFGDSFDFKADGVKADIDVDNTWLAGAHLGYNWQTGRSVVLGIEGDWDFLGGDRDAEIDGLKGTQDDNWLATIRGRLGYAMGPALIYATGGVAFLNSDDMAPFDDTVTGWVAGGGIDYKIRSNVSVGLEGLYYAFDDDADFEGDHVSYDRDFWSVRARLTYHFGDHYEEPLK